MIPNPGSESRQLRTTVISHAGPREGCRFRPVPLPTDAPAGVRPRIHRLPQNWLDLLRSAALIHLLYSLFRGVAKGVKRVGLGNFETTSRPILLAALGGLLVSTLGILIPPSMFWSESETGVIAEPGTDLPHIWPQVRKVWDIVLDEFAHNMESRLCVSNVRQKREANARSRRLSLEYDLLQDATPLLITYTRHSFTFDLTCSLWFPAWLEHWCHPEPFSGRSVLRPGTISLGHHPHVHARWICEAAGDRVQRTNWL